MGLLADLTKELANASNYIDGSELDIKYKRMMVPAIEFNEAIAIIKKHLRKEKKRLNGKNRLVKRKNIRS